MCQLNVSVAHVCQYVACTALQIVCKTAYVTADKPRACQQTRIAIDHISVEASGLFVIIFSPFLPPPRSNQNFKMGIPPSAVF